MKKLILFILLIISSAGFALAQTAPKIPANWQKFAPDGEEFIVEVPQKMVETINWHGVNEQKYIFASADYRKYFNGVFYFISSTVLPPKNISAVPFLSGQLKSFINEFDKESETIKFGDFKGIKYEFKDSEGFYHTIIFVQANNRAYRFHIVQEQQVSEEASRFLNSIHLFSEVLKPKNYEETFKIFSLDSFFDYKNPANPNQSVKQDSADVTSIKILTKPRASYTDLARVYELQGSVAVSAEFLANGEIGEIIPLKKLPFGLTQSVINVVKGIKFEPAKKNGVAITTTKQLIYSFTLY
jgi:hypothetical protein